MATLEANLKVFFTAYLEANPNANSLAMLKTTWGKYNCQCGDKFKSLFRANSEKLQLSVQFKPIQGVACNSTL